MNVASVAKGASGPNDIYLMQLHSFLTHNAAQQSTTASLALEDHSGDEQTQQLAFMVQLLQSEYMPFFLFGAGSNEDNQLLLNSNACRVKEIHELTEMILIAPRLPSALQHMPKSLHAGGGHSGLLAESGELYLWGWNESGQLGRSKSNSPDKDLPFPEYLVLPLSDIKVEHAKQELVYRNRYDNHRH